MGKCGYFLGLFCLFNFTPIYAEDFPALPSHFDYLVRVTGKNIQFDLNESKFYRAHVVRAREGLTLEGDINILLEENLEIGQFVACMHIYQKLFTFTILFSYDDHSIKLIDTKMTLPHFTSEEDLLSLKRVADNREKGEATYEWSMPTYVGLFVPRPRETLGD